jgi:hypothetical protein
MRTVSLFGVLACMALPWAASAQNPQPAQPHESAPAVAPPNAPSPPPEEIRPDDSGRAAGRGSVTGQNTLSDRLSRDQGTLRPPAMDPGIHAPLPPRSDGTMPVIPPPGSPGGDQKVVPK